VPFAVISDYEKGHMGRYHGLNSEVEVVNLQPTLSYKINDQVSVGGGLVISRIYGKLTRAIPMGKINPLLAGQPDGHSDVEGDDISYGYNLGVLVDVNERLSWGLTYHSKVKYNLEGDTTVSGITPAPTPIPGLTLGTLNTTYDASVDITMPESVDTSVTYRLDDQWTLYGGATWTRWSRLESLVIENQTSNPIQAGVVGRVEEPLKWSDTWSFAVGTAYQLNPQWVLRAGLALDESPTTNEHRTTRIPVSDRTILSLGAGWNINQDVTLDLAYSYLKEDKGEVNQTGYNAEYENSAHGLAAQLTYRF
jgi:long-chain fatty acid transport protein